MTGGTCPVGAVTCAAGSAFVDAQVYEPVDAASVTAFTGAPHDNSAADEDSGQCITHHEELATACAWTCDGQQLLSISDAGVMSSRRAPDAPPPPAAARGGDDEDTLDGTWPIIPTMNNCDVLTRCHVARRRRRAAPCGRRCAVCRNSAHAITCRSPPPARF